MQKFQTTNKVSTSTSLTTSKTLVNVSRVSYGHINGKSLHITRKPSQMVMHSLLVFAAKNGLTIN